MNGTWNMKTCLSRDWGNLETNLTEDGDKLSGSHCPPVWDGFTCWGPTAAGSTASSKCPSFKGSDISKSAFRVCSLTGEWQDRDGAPSAVGWTNYTPCLTPEIREIMRRLGSNDEAQTKLDIAANTRILEFVCLSLSLAALLLSLFIFYYFRTLRNSRTRLHRHLFIAMVIQVAIRLTVYADQAIIRSIETRNENGSRSEIDFSPGRRGIDNTPILCEASYVSLEYARTAMFMWMFVEGLFLHNMITVTVFEEKLSPLVYPVIGWIIPIPLTVAWAIVTHLHYGSATCWWGYNFTLYFWILEGPRLAVLMVNLAFLLNILRVLVTKLRQSNSSETQQALKAVKAALVLLPLLGLTNLLNMLDAPLEKSPFQFALWSYTTHLLTSTQGFILAFLYCFRNGEVQMAVRKFVRLRVLGNSKHIILAKKSVPLSALDNASLFNNDSGAGSQTANINHSQRTMTKITARSDHTSQHQNNHFLLHKQTAKTSPLVVRSYSNGVLKQSTVKADPQSRNQHYQHQHQNRRHNPDENLCDDGRKPLLFKNYHHDDPTMSMPSMSNPITMASSAAAGFYQYPCNYNCGGSSSGNVVVDGGSGGMMRQQLEQSCSPTTSSKQVRTKQMSEWGKLIIIPDLFRRRASSASIGKGQYFDDVDSSPKQKGSRNTTGIVDPNVRDDDDYDDEGSEAEENFSEDDEFVSVEMDQESNLSTPYHPGICKILNSDSRLTLAPCNNGNDDLDDLGYDNGETVQISMEIVRK